MPVALDTSTSPLVKDPFGPDFKLECPVCLTDDVIANSDIQSCYLFDCNANHVRASAMDKICIDLAKASLAGRTVEWINEDMTIDPGKLRNATVLNTKEKGTLNNQPQLLDEKGYFNSDGIHGLCQDCFKTYVDDQNRKYDPLKCVVCRKEPGNRLNPIFRSAALDLKIKGTLDLKNAADSNPLFDPVEPIQISSPQRPEFRFDFGNTDGFPSEELPIYLENLDRFLNPEFRFDFESSRRPRPQLRRSLETPIPQRRTEAISGVSRLTRVALGCITLIGMLYCVDNFGMATALCLGLPALAYASSVRVEVGTGNSRLESTPELQSLQSEDLLPTIQRAEERMRNRQLTSVPESQPLQSADLLGDMNDLLGNFDSEFFSPYSPSTEGLLRQPSHISYRDDIPYDPQPSQAPPQERSSKIFGRAMGLLIIASMVYIAYHVAAFMIVQLRQIAPRLLPFQPSRYIDLV